MCDVAGIIGAFIALTGSKSRLIRIRIVQSPPIRDVDGIALDCFQAGEEYEVGNHLAALFLAEGWAEPVPLDEPRPYTPFGPDDPFDSRVLYRDLDAPPNLTRERHPPYLDRDLAAELRWQRRDRDKRRRPKS